MLTPSNQLTLGTSAPNFSLLDTISGQTLALNELKGTSGTVIMFICNHCPFVLHINAKLVELANHYQAQGIKFIAISSNDVVTYPQDGPEAMTAHAQSEGYSFPYLYDEDQSVAKAFKAACTPDIYLFDEDLKLTYHGQLDDSRPGNGKPVTGADLSAAIEAILENKPATEVQRPSIGCNIKWKMI